MIKIDEEKCIGCGSCESVCPKGFEMKDGKAYVKNSNASRIKEAIDICPVNAII